MYISFKQTPSRIKYVDWRLCQYMRYAPAAPTTPSVTLDHQQVSPGPPGAASGTHNEPNGVDLAQTRLHRREVLERRSRGDLRAAPLAAEGASRARRTPPTLPAAVRPLPAAAARVRRPTPVPCEPMAASTAGQMGTRRRHCDDTATCQSTANGAQMNRGRPRCEARAAG